MFSSILWIEWHVDVRTEPVNVQGRRGDTLTPQSLERPKPPVAIILGDTDPVAPPATNGLVGAKLIPHAELSLPPAVGYYDRPGVRAPAATIDATATLFVRTPGH